jgi:hypothetical protein
MYKSKTKEYRAKYWKLWKEKNRPNVVKVCVKCDSIFSQSSNVQKLCENCRKSTCAYCGVIFLDKSSQKLKFCSVKCYTDSNKGKYPGFGGKRGSKPRTYHLREDAKHFGAEYNEWRVKVFKRDNFICQNCKKTSNELKKEKIKINADHIKPFCNYPELRYEVSNGRTLCVPCHKLTETYGIKARNFSPATRD